MTATINYSKKANKVGAKNMATAKQIRPDRRSIPVTQGCSGWRLSLDFFEV